MKAIDILVATGLLVVGSSIYQFAIGPRPWAEDFIAGGVMFGASLAVVAAIRK